MKKRYLGVALTLTAALAITGCSNGGSSSGGGGGDISATPEMGGTLNVLKATEFSHLDPAQGFDGGVNNFYRLLYRTLTTQSTGEGSKGTEIVPDLATELGTPNEDATEWTYTLKDDIFFEDGTPITSETIKYGVERTFDPNVATGSPYARILLEGVEDYQGPEISGELASISTPDDKTITFKLNQPFADFDSVVGQNVFVPFPADAGITATSLDEMPISSGPYKVEKFDRGSKLVLVRNDKWDRDTDDIRGAYPDSFVFTFGLDAATIDERMIAGQGTDVDAIGDYLLSSNISRIQTPEIQARTLSGLQGCTTYMGLNTTKEVFKNPLVRQAVNYAVDKTSVQTSSGGSQFAEIANTMLPPTVAGRMDFNLFETEGNNGDPEKAKELLAEAGYPDGVEFTVDLMSRPLPQAQAESMQQSLAKAGITMNLNVIEAAKYYETIGTTSQQSDAAITGWCPDWPTGATFLPPLFEGTQIFEKGNSNIAQLNDPAINAKIEEIRGMTDVAEANKAWGELDKEIMALAPAVPMIYQKVIYVVGNNVAGAYLHDGFSGGIDFVSVGLQSVKK
ncbi:ABC transporter substrate-binding protein [Lysinibacter cavernae]|uniref:Peptide/nickel transport system substrate-binding protein n=1 Tax=Lysinibacter cavernae TaxID=1640652 RepID=A0A7X5QYE9_9MICO|nr:ABC transporter substrate-binding protein [Lysinibacter cavernae]NIH52304.1 peptide/nickel transport system substrate-binding protein [Lysinibacter cavernae]